MRETSTPTRAVESPSENEVSRFMHLRAPSEELSGGEAGHRNWESAADLGIVGHERNLQLLDHARFFFGRALRACLKIQLLEKVVYFLSNAIPLAPVWPLLTSGSGFRQSDHEQ